MHINLQWRLVKRQHDVVGGGQPSNDAANPEPLLGQLPVLQNVVGRRRMSVVEVEVFLKHLLQVLPIHFERQLLFGKLLQNRLGFEAIDPSLLKLLFYCFDHYLLLESLLLLFLDAYLCFFLRFVLVKLFTLGLLPAIELVELLLADAKFCCQGFVGVSTLTSQKSILELQVNVFLELPTPKLLLGVPLVLEPNQRLELDIFFSLLHKLLEPLNQCSLLWFQLDLTVQVLLLLPPILYYLNLGQFVW